ncbi:hypothetical protein QZH41_003251 [Actinostola sp. cb2023]|nr:hypothetical protein QZH41_003251 [Actinostola sp. cb2023]
MDRDEYTRLLQEASVDDTSKFVPIDDKRPKQRGRPPKHFHPLLQKEKEIHTVVHQILPKPIAVSVSPNGSRLAHLYGLPKTHKEKLSMRPILSASGTYNYHIAKWLEEKLSPLSVNEYTINDTFGFSDEIRKFSIKENDIVNDWFNNTYNLKLKKDQLVKLLEIATTNQLFQLNGQLYEQVDGVAMGSPLGPLMANIFMCSLEDKLTEQNLVPSLYRRFAALEEKMKQLENKQNERGVTSALAALRRNLARPVNFFDQFEAIEQLEALVRVARTTVSDKADEYAAILDEVKDRHASLPPRALRRLMSGLLGDPVIFTGKTRLHSNTALYSTLTSIARPISDSVSALTMLIASFDWKFVNVLGSDDMYGREFTSLLNQNLRAYNICVATEKLLDTRNLDVQLPEAIAALRSKPQTKRLIRIFSSLKRNRFLSNYWYSFVACSIVLVQVIFSAVYLAFFPPERVNIFHDNLTVSTHCSRNLGMEIASFGYNCLLAFLCASFAIKSRNLPETYSEAIHICLTMLTDMISWMVYFFGYYGIPQGKLKVAVPSFGVIIGAYAVLFFIFVPKIRVILFLPEKNTKKAALAGTRKCSVDVACGIQLSISKSSRACERQHTLATLPAYYESGISSLGNLDNNGNALGSRFSPEGLGEAIKEDEDIPEEVSRNSFDNIRQEHKITIKNLAILTPNGLA